MSAAQKTKPLFVNADRIAQELGVTPNTVRNWTRRTLMPHYPISGQYHYVLSEVLAWAKGLAVAPPGDVSHGPVTGAIKQRARVQANARERREKARQG